MINLTIQNTIQNTIKNTLGNLSEKFITQLFVPIGSDSFITADNKIFKVRVDMSTLLYLFAEDQRGVWYDPSDLATMFQESTGTTAVTADGQPVGLVLDKSQGLGVKNTASTWINASWDTFAPTGTGFTASKDSAGGVDLCYSAQTFPVTLGKIYKVTIDVDTTTLFDYQVLLSSTTNSRSTTSTFNGSGVKTGYVLANTSSGNFSIQVKTTFVGAITVNSVSIEEVLGNHASQPVATKRPTYKDTPDRLEIDLVDDSLAFTVPTGGIDGYMVVGTDEGTASYGVSLPAGDYDIGGNFFMGSSVNGFLLREGAVSAADLSNVEKDFVSKGAKASYGDVTDFSYYWRDKGITEFPLIDTSSGTNFSLTWYGNNLTSFPLIDTSSGTNFYNAWQNNNLTSFPLIDTSSGANFSFAWRNNNLTSFPSIDTSNGTDFSYAWFGNNLTGFPLLDTSSGTNFLATWYGNANLSDFPASMFDNCLATNFNSAFINTGLSQSSIDGILVSIESNGTSNGTFNQSGGSAPSATGQAAIDAMRSRGWTITVTGGY